MGLKRGLYGKFSSPESIEKRILESHGIYSQLVETLLFKYDEGYAMLLKFKPVIDRLYIEADERFDDFWNLESSQYDALGYYDSLFILYALHYLKQQALQKHIEMRREICIWLLKLQKEIYRHVSDFENN